MECIWLAIPHMLLPRQYMHYSKFGNYIKANPGFDLGYLISKYHLFHFLFIRTFLVLRYTRLFSSLA